MVLNGSVSALKMGKSLALSQRLDVDSYGSRNPPVHDRGDGLPDPLDHFHDFGLARMGATQHRARVGVAE